MEARTVSGREKSLKTIFDEAAEIASPEERAAFLETTAAAMRLSAAMSMPCFWPLTEPAASWKCRRRATCST